jgi:hypothetical protein
MIIVSSKSQINTRSRLFSGSGEGLGCLLPRPRPDFVAPIKWRQSLLEISQFEKKCSLFLKSNQVSDLSALLHSSTGKLDLQVFKFTKTYYHLE